MVAMGLDVTECARRCAVPCVSVVNFCGGVTGCSVAALANQLVLFNFLVIYLELLGFLKKL